MFKNEPIGFSKVAILAVLVFAFAILQTSGFVVFGIKPNLVLAALVAFAFIAADLVSFTILILAAVIGLRWLTGWDSAILVLSVVSFAVWLFVHLFPGKEILNLAIAVAAATVIFYLILDPFFILQETAGLAAELVYNLIVSWALLCLFYKNS